MDAVKIGVVLLLFALFMFYGCVITVSTDNPEIHVGEINTEDQSHQSFENQGMENQTSIQNGGSSHNQQGESEQSGGASTIEGIKFNYTSKPGPCEHEFSSIIQIGEIPNVSPPIARISIEKTYVCCSDLTYYAYVNETDSGNELSIVIKNVGEECKCLACITADITIEHPERFSKVNVFGIEYKDIRKPELIHSFEIK